MTSLLRKSALAVRVARTMGPGWVAFRARYALAKRLGSLERRLPACSWDDLPLAANCADPDALVAKLGRFFFSCRDRPASAERLRRFDEAGQGPTAEADDVARGFLRYFSVHRVEVGFPPDWHRTADGGAFPQTDRHWSRIGDFGHGDVKVVWEPSRFAFAYPLVRAYWRTGDPSYAETFWRAVDDWRDRNPPQRGPNWKCGQEAAFRVMAWCFGLHGFLDAPAATPGRIARLVQMIAASGRRIEANVAYALSQRNNHGVSEGLGLWTIGLLFPFLRRAEDWREQGRRILESEAAALIDDDGGFAQHSFNYQRLMLHDYAWALRLGDLHSLPLSDALRKRVRRSAELLYQVEDPETGGVPCFGHNDGSLVLPLNNCGYLDYRPTTQLLGCLLHGSRRHPPGPWDEDLFWLLGPEALDAPLVEAPRADLDAEAGGYVGLRSPSSFAFTRCGPFRHRPSHADLLHVDLWRRGVNIAVDAGTYSYNSPKPWDNALAETRWHNAVTVDGAGQIVRVGKFLWVDWPLARRLRKARSAAGSLAYWEGEHTGYARLPAPVACRRAVARFGDECWLVVDDLQSEQPHDYRLHWLLSLHPHEWDPSTDPARLVLDTPAGPYAALFGATEPPDAISLVSADPDSPRGWRSPHYLERVPALSVELERRASCVRFWTAFAPGGTTVTRDGSQIHFAGPGWTAEADLGADPRGPILVDLECRAEAVERLNLAAR